jgi:transposase
LPKANRGPEQLAARFIALIGKLYRVEALGKEQGLDALALLQSRQTHSVPVLQEIQALLLANVHAVLPGSLLCKALHYLSSQWVKLERFVTNVSGWPYRIDKVSQPSASGVEAARRCGGSGGPEAAQGHP